MQSSTYVMHKENGACTRGEIHLDFHWVYTSIVTNADEWKWRQIGISAAFLTLVKPACSCVPPTGATFLCKIPAFISSFPGPHATYSTLWSEQRLGRSERHRPTLTPQSPKAGNKSVWDTWTGNFSNHSSSKTRVECPNSMAGTLHRCPW